MASLRLPRLCCPEKDAGTELVLGSTLYHALCGCSALLGLLGLTICCHCRNKRKRRTVRAGGRVLLASALVTAGILLHSVLSLSVPDFLSSQRYGLSQILCVVISTWIHYFCSVLFWAFFCYSLEIDQLLRPNPSERLGILCTVLCYGASSLLCLHGLLMLAIPSASETRCDSTQGLVLFHDVLLYTPLLLALFVSPLLLRRAISGVPAVLKMQCGVYTCSERFKKQNLCRRLMQISGTFIACWLGNLICDFLLLLVEVWGTSQPPRRLQVAAITTLVFTGILNPMFCSVHSLAFFGWRSSAACVSQSSVAAETPSGTGLEGENSSLVEEGHHLLRTQSVENTGKLSFPNILKLMDSCSSVEFSCSVLEKDAVRLLGTWDPVPVSQDRTEFQPQHSV